MRNQHLIGINEHNKNANGGTEITTRQLFDRLEPEELDGVQIITSRVRELDPDKIRIYHLHDLPGDPNASHLKDAASRDRFDHIVFSSNWQYQQFRNELGMPWSSQCSVIETGVESFPAPQQQDPRTNPIKLVYTSTPHRGLELLVPVFEQLVHHYPFVELHVYSTFKLYGWPERDQPYEELFERCRQHPNIHYHGLSTHENVRQAYLNSHIFAYPSIWPETSCRCLIEAMMAGCLCIHPNLAALPDTAGGMTQMYDGDVDPQAHATTFFQRLATVVETLRTTDLWESSSFQSGRTFQRVYAHRRFGWNAIVPRWSSLIQHLKGQLS